MLGRHYHRVYGYPWRWAIVAELAWRVEHWAWLPGDVTWPYRLRKAFERRGAAS